MRQYLFFRLKFKIIAGTHCISILESHFDIFKRCYYLDTIACCAQYLTNGKTDRRLFSEDDRGGNCIDIAEFFYTKNSQLDTGYYGIDSKFDHCFFATLLGYQLRIYDPTIFSEVVLLTSGSPIIKNSIEIKFDKDKMQVILIPFSKDPIVYSLYKPHSESKLILDDEKNKLIQNLCGNGRFTMTREFPNKERWLLKVDFELRAVIIRSAKENQGYPIERWIQNASESDPLIIKISTLFDCVPLQLINKLSQLDCAIRGDSK